MISVNTDSAKPGQTLAPLVLHLLVTFGSSHLAWNTLPKAPSPMSRTYSMLLRGYSRLRSLELRRSGSRWYMGLGWSLSSKSS